METFGVGALIANPMFKNLTIFDENFVAVEMNRGEIIFNKPIYIGMCILDIAKTTIYNFHYDYMRTKFNK